MKFIQLKHNWDIWAKEDPLWAICTDGGKRGNRWDREEFFQTGNAEIVEVLDHIEGLGLDVNRGSSLDFGCGVGRLTQALASRFDYCVGVDISSEMVRLATEFGGHLGNCSFVENSENDLKIFANGTFDFIYCSRVLQHMEPADMVGYLAEFLRTLRQNGLLVFQLPSRQIGAKHIAKKILPISAINLMRRVVYRSAAVMEMYIMPQEEVLKAIARLDGTVLGIRETTASGSDYTSLEYVATK